MSGPLLEPGMEGLGRDKFIQASIRYGKVFWFEHTRPDPRLLESCSLYSKYRLMV